MKTTENISLAGYAFTIESDAYLELGEYLADIRATFSTDASADEIAADIEERIAELLSERCTKGMVVNMAMVRDIKARIGNPQELAQDEPSAETAGQESEPPQEKKNWKNKRMYRDIDGRILGGVCSGLGAYFGLDKVIFRVLFLIFFLIGFSDKGLFCIPMVFYICLWIAMPAARTVEQKCELKGKPIDLESFRSRDFDLNREVKDVVRSPVGRTFRRAGGVFIGLILLTIGLAGLLGCIAVPYLPSFLDSRITLNHWGPVDGLTQLNADIITSSTFWALVLISMVTAFVGMLYGGIMMTFDLKNPSWKPGLVIFIAWLISLFVLAAWVIKTFAEALPTALI